MTSSRSPLLRLVGRVFRSTPNTFVNLEHSRQTTGPFNSRPDDERLLLPRTSRGDTGYRPDGSNPEDRTTPYRFWGIRRYLPRNSRVQWTEDGGLQCSVLMMVPLTQAASHQVAVKVFRCNSRSSSRADVERV